MGTFVSTLIKSILICLIRTIALSFINGSVISVAKVEANPEYDEMMARFSLKLSQHPR